MSYYVKIYCIFFVMFPSNISMLGYIPQTLQYQYSKAPPHTQYYQEKKLEK